MKRFLLLAVAGSVALVSCSTPAPDGADRRAIDLTMGDYDGSSVEAPR